MRVTWEMMGMPMTIELADPTANQHHFEVVINFFQYIDVTFSTYISASEISRINRGEVPLGNYSPDMKDIFALAEKTKQDTFGYFDIAHHGTIDPSGIVKGWAIQRAADMLRKSGLKNFYLNLGGDIAVVGKNAQGQPWRVGLQNPFTSHQNVKVLSLTDCGIATSGTYLRGQHIYNPKQKGLITEIVSLTVVGPNVLEADRFATAAFAMGRPGIGFIEQLPGFEGYMIDRHGTATLTSGFDSYQAST